MEKSMEVTMKSIINGEKFAERFKQLIEENNDTIYTIAEVLHLSAPTISRYINNKMIPKITTIEILARHYNVDPTWLLGYDVPKRLTKELVKGHRIPVLGAIPAGVPTEAVENIVDWEEIPAEWLTGQRDYFGLQITGDSMYPEYQSGDTVIVRKQSTCDSGDDCVVLINGVDATLKRVYMIDEQIELVSVNKMYGKRTFSSDEVKSLPVTILGVVVELRRKKK
jgi:repressor LexA